MKVLVDACIWSLALRRKPGKLNPEEQSRVSALSGLIQDGRAVLVGVIRQEVLSGIRDSRQFERTLQLLDAFPDEEVKACDHVEAARLFNLCRGRGVECGTIDMLLCAVAIRREWEILTSDQGLRRCMGALRAEGIPAGGPEVEGR